MGERSVAIERDAVGTVITTGDNNDVRVTIVVADRSLLAQIRAPYETAGPTFNPYRGLDAFRETDSRWYFGRQKLIFRAWQTFQGMQRGSSPRIMPIIGASGSGKSSLVRAGLLPQLALQPMEGLDRPMVMVLRPRAAPLHELSEVLARLPGSHANLEGELATRAEDGTYRGLYRIADARPDKDRSRLVIVVDQFEELFTEREDATAREAFLGNLEFATSQPDRLVSVIFTLRNDFASAVPPTSTFGRSVRERALPVQAMSRDELACAIEQPARELGAPWPSIVVEGLVDQVEGRAGALPLLQFALQQLWPKHITGQLEKVGSARLIEDFLTSAADAAFDAAEVADQLIIRRAFLAMVQLGEGTADTRRVARLSEFVASGEDPQRVREVLGPFTKAEARLITASEQEKEPTYELTHEALIASWARLREWLGHITSKAESARIRADLRLHRRLALAAAEWKAGRSGFWRPPELDLLKNYRERGEANLTAEEKEFADASVDELDNQLRKERIRTTAIKGLAIFLGIALILSIYLGVNASTAQKSAETNYQLALEQAAGSVRELLNGYYAGEISTELVQTLIEKAQKTVQNLPTEKTSQKEDITAAQIRLLDVLSSANITLGHVSQARTFSQQQVELLNQQLPNYPESTDWRELSARAHGRFGEALFWQGDLDVALVNLDRAAEVAEQLVTLNPDNDEHQELLIAYITRVGDTLRAKGDLDKADEAYSKCLRRAEGLAKNAKNPNIWLMSVADAHQRLGDGLLSRNRPEDAAEHYKRYNEIAGTLKEKVPHDTRFQHRLSYSYQRLGDAFLIQKNLPKALEHYKIFQDMAKELSNNTPSNFYWRQDLAVSYQRFGEVYLEQSAYDSALREFMTYLKLVLETQKRDPSNGTASYDLSNAYQKVADALYAKKEYSTALENHRVSNSIAETLNKKDPSNSSWQLILAISHQRIGMTLAAMNDMQGAINAYQRCLASPVRGAPFSPRIRWPRNVHENCRQELNHSLGGKTL
jgi:tetratricopeptide (TPR) repeat protein